MEQLTWLELHSDKMHNFLQEDEFYSTPLRDALKISIPFKSLHDCLHGYDKAGSYLRKRSVTLEEKGRISSCFGLAIAKFLIEQKHFKWKLKRRSWTKIYYEPLILYKNDQYTDPVGVSVRCLTKNRKLSFEFYYWALTDITFDDLSKELLSEQVES
ncbi:hypothetical protein [Hymenobacter aerophilus]|uniref:hypothetical protein n=1 Tax=Hymenobacter aerophilus TaxID=119644 RepID=UPI0012FB0A0A|nr:hypothetical protein [Hymenobacter aerophilus]